MRTRQEWLGRCESALRTAARQAWRVLDQRQVSVDGVARVIDCGDLSYAADHAPDADELLRSIDLALPAILPDRWLAATDSQERRAVERLLVAINQLAVLVHGARGTFVPRPDRRDAGLGDYRPAPAVRMEGGAA